MDKLSGQTRLCGASARNAGQAAVSWAGSLAECSSENINKNISYIVEHQQDRRKG